MPSYTQALATPQANITLRPTTDADAPAYRELRLEALRLHPTAFASDYATDADKPAEFWQQRVRVQDGIDMRLVAEVGNRLVGTCGVFRTDRIKCQHNANIVGVYVQAQWRSMGLAEALLQICVTWAKDHDVKIVKLGVSTNNAPAIKTYLKCGFNIYGVEPMALRVYSVDYDEFLMARVL